MRRAQLRREEMLFRNYNEIVADYYRDELMLEGTPQIVDRISRPNSEAFILAECGGKRFALYIVGDNVHGELSEEQFREMKAE